MERTAPRRPVVAFLLSMLLPGLGHVYNGHLLRGILFSCGFWLLVLAPTLAGLISSFTGMICFSAAAILCQIFIATHAAVEASRLQTAQLKWYNLWYVYVGIWLLVDFGSGPLLILLAQHNLVKLRPFNVPSAAMEPTLKVGDHFVARLEHYGDRIPARGDIVVFPFPEDKSKVFVKRIIGLPAKQSKSRIRWFS